MNSPEFLKGLKELFECNHKWELAIPESQVKIGGSVPYKCSKCGAKHTVEPRARRRK